MTATARTITSDAARKDFRVADLSLADWGRKEPEFTWEHTDKAEVLAADARRRTRRQVRVA